MMVSFVLSFFPRDVLDEILNLIESVSEDFPSYFYLTRYQPGLHEAFRVICRPGMHSPCFFFDASLQCMAQMLTRHTFSSAIRCMIKMGSKQSFAHSAKIILPVFRTLLINNLRRKWHGCRMSRMGVSKASVLPAVVQSKKK